MDVKPREPILKIRAETFKFWTNYGAFDEEGRTTILTKLFWRMSLKTRHKMFAYESDEFIGISEHARMK